MAEVRFGHPMRAWQRECAELASGCRFLVMVLHRRAGKTEFALKKLLDAAVKNQLDLPNYFYVAPQLKQARAIAWARLKQMVELLRVHGAVEVSEVDSLVRFAHNGAVVRIYGADNPDSMRGVRLDGCVVDEVAQTKPQVWEEILRPALSDRSGWAWFIGTPKGVNLFSELFFAAEGREGWRRARYTVDETDALAVEEVALIRAEMSENAFAREYLCDFAAAGDDQLISLTDVEAAARRRYTARDVSSQPRILGVDPARFGDDRSVLVSRRGLVVLEPQVFRGVDNMDLAARVAARIEQWQPDAVFVDSGAGAGVIDRLRQLGHSVVEVNFGGRPVTDARFANRRAEMWMAMADAVRAGLAIPNDASLKVELATPVYRYDAQQRLIIESKDEIRKRLPGAGSPDIADALALTFAAPVRKRDGLALAGSRPHSFDYDPYA